MEKITKIPLLSKIQNLEHGTTNLLQAEQARKALSATCARAKQVHGTKLIWVSAFEQGAQEADAIATTTPGLRIGVFTADCSPLLCVAVHSTTHQPLAVMSIHAGWRGAAGGIQTKCLQEFVARTDSSKCEYYLGIGPTISFDTFEVGQEVVDAFPQIESRGNARFTHMEGERRKYLLDLPAEIEAQVRQEASNLGIKLQIDRLDHCTHKMVDTYPSFRRQKGTNSRILSFISFSN